MWSWGARCAKDDKGTLHVAPAACEMVKHTGANMQTNTRLVFHKRCTAAHEHTTSFVADLIQPLWPR